MKPKTGPRGAGARVERSLTPLLRGLRRWQGGYRALAAALPPAGLIVDLGAGWGFLAEELRRCHPARRVLCVEHDPRRLAVLRELEASEGVSVCPGDLRTVSLPPAEGIALIDVLHYFDARHQSALLARCCAALRTGGVLLLRDPDPRARWRFPLTRGYEALATSTGATRARIGRYRSGGEWADLLREMGLLPEVAALPSRSPFCDRVVRATRP